MCGWARARGDETFIKFVAASRESAGDLILKEARDAKDSIINEARTKATVEADRLLQIAREGIQNEKMAAITELKNQVAVLSLEIAEKILKEELSSAEKQQQLVSAYLKEAEFVK